jgi:hypothetical protein
VSLVLAPRATLGACAGLRGSSGFLGAPRGWGRAGLIEQAVVALLHVLEHLEEHGFPLAGVAFALQRRLFPRLGFGQLTLERVQHVMVDVHDVMA